MPSKRDGSAGLEAREQLALPAPRRHGALLAEASDYKASSDPALVAATAARAAANSAEQDWVRTRLRVGTQALLARARCLLFRCTP